MYDQSIWLLPCQGLIIAPGSRLCLRLISRAYCGLFLYTYSTCYSSNFLPVCTYYGMRLTVVCTETSSTYVSGFTHPSSPYKTFRTVVVNSANGTYIATCFNRRCRSCLTILTVWIDDCVNENENRDVYQTITVILNTFRQSRSYWILSDKFTDSYFSNWKKWQIP